LGIEAQYDYTPRVYRRIVFAAVQGSSFNEASETLAELAELQLLPKRVWRAAKRIGEERVAETQQAVAGFKQLPLPARQLSPIEPVPGVACVQMDGGRYQERERIAEPEDAAGSAPAKPFEATSEPDSDGHWREYKAGVLATMASDVHAEDPCPELPATFADPGKMREIAREIKGFTTDSQVSCKADEEAGPDFKERVGRPEVLVKSVVATSGDIDAFGPQLAAAAYERGFFAALRKAFVADGSDTNWSVWRQFFSHFTPVLDFVHALMYVYAGAMTGRPPNEGWPDYRLWAQWLWKGEIDPLLAALERRQQELGLPEPKETGTPRAQVAKSLTYLTNQRQRMKYDEYRKQGLPITSSLIESTIKQINRRIKGTEKFWDEGADPMLHLVADRFSQTSAAGTFWSRRLTRLINAASYHQAA
jgi:hypothetical protein